MSVKKLEVTSDLSALATLHINRRHNRAQVPTRERAPCCAIVSKSLLDHHKRGLYHIALLHHVKAFRLSEAVRLQLATAAYLKVQSTPAPQDTE